MRPTLNSNSGHHNISPVIKCIYNAVLRCYRIYPRQYFTRLSNASTSMLNLVIKDIFTHALPGYQMHPRWYFTRLSKISSLMLYQVITCIKIDALPGYQMYPHQYITYSQVQWNNIIVVTIHHAPVVLSLVYSQAERYKNRHVHTQ